MRVETSEGFIVSSRLFFFLTPSKTTHSLLQRTTTAGAWVPKQGRDAGRSGRSREAPRPGFSPASPFGFALQTHPGGFSIAREKAFSIEFPS